MRFIIPLFVVKVLIFLHTLNEICINKQNYAESHPVRFFVFYFMSGFE